MRASAHMWLKRAAPPSGKLGSTPAGAPPWAPPQAVAQGWRCPLGPGRPSWPLPAASPQQLTRVLRLGPTTAVAKAGSVLRVVPGP